MCQRTLDVQVCEVVDQLLRIKNRFILMDKDFGYNVFQKSIEHNDDDVLNVISPI